MDYDPMFTSVGPAFISNFLDYYHNDLKFGRDKDYTVSGRLFMKWDWAHSQPDSRFPLPSPNTMPDRSSTLLVVVFIGLLLAAAGNGFMQPASYAGVRKFSNKETATMGYGLLYAGMNLGIVFIGFVSARIDRHAA